jgi:hypothetical protein
MACLSRTFASDFLSTKGEFFDGIPVVFAPALTGKALLLLCWNIGTHVCGWRGYRVLDLSQRLGLSAATRFCLGLGSSFALGSLVFFRLVGAVPRTTRR